MARAAKLDLRAFQQELAARLRHIAQSLSELFPHGGSGTDGSQKALGLLKKPFMEGAARAYSEDKSRDFDIAQNFVLHNGYPVGLYCRLGYLMEHFPHSNLGPTTFNPINGPERQQLIIGGGDSGRFIFNADKAWKHGYLVQRSIKPRDFWEPVFSMAASDPSTSIVY
jgi:hypothetical protein